MYPQTFEFLFIKLRWHFMLRLKFLTPQSNTRENCKVQLVVGRLSNRIIIIIIINRKTAKSKSVRFLFRMCQMGHDFDRSKVKKIVFSLETVHALCVHKVCFFN